MSIIRIDQELSLMIPRVFPQWIDEATIVDIFHKQNIGQVYKVSIVRQPDSKRRSYPIYQAFIYFSMWYENEIAYNFQQRIFGPKKQARIVYDDPWFWVAFENTKQRLSNNDRRIIRVGRMSIKAWQKLDQIHDSLTECEEIMRELKQTTDHQKLMIADFQKQIPTVQAQQQIPTVQQQVLQQCINSFLEDEDTIMNDADPEPSPMHNLSVQECIDELLDSEMTDLQVPEQDTVLSFKPVDPVHINWNHRNLTSVASAMLGDEFALTEMAINVAEAALRDEDYDNSIPMPMEL